jgi:hypothetical protein
VPPVCELLAVGEIGAQLVDAVLVEDGTAGVFKDDVGERVAGFGLLADFVVQIVVGVLGFPEAAEEVVFVLKGAVGDDVLGVPFCGVAWVEASSRGRGPCRRAGAGRRSPARPRCGLRVPCRFAARRNMPEWPCAWA